MPNLTLTPGSLPAGWCPTPGSGALQEIYEKFFELGYAVLPTGAGYSIKVSECASPPSADEQDTVLWVPVDGDGKPLGIYKWSPDGYWCWPACQGDNEEDERRLFAGTESEVWAYDGGDGSDPSASVPTEYTGAMWEVDHTFDFRMPIGPGTSADATVIAVGDTGGTENHTLTEAELPPHLHNIVSDTNQGSVSWDNLPTADKAIVRRSSDPGGDSEYALCSEQLDTPEASVGASSTVGDGDPHTNMPPYKAIFLIKRTARRFYTPPC